LASTKGSEVQGGRRNYKGRRRLRAAGSQCSTGADQTASTGYPSRPCCVACTSRSARRNSTTGSRRATRTCCSTGANDSAGAHHTTSANDTARAIRAAGTSTAPRSHSASDSTQATATAPAGVLVAACSAGASNLGGRSIIAAGAASAAYGTTRAANPAGATRSRVEFDFVTAISSPVERNRYFQWLISLCVTRRINSSGFCLTVNEANGPNLAKLTDVMPGL
jgi:hypothetical protein